MTHPTPLAAVGLRRAFGRRLAVRDLSLRVGAGEVVGLLGPNGAGKTTTFRMLCGALRPHAGHVELTGQDVSRWPLWRRARAGLGYLPQGATIFRRLTVAQNLRAGLARRKLSPAQQSDAVDALLHQLGLTQLRDARGDTLSGGERRRAEIGRALAAQPAVLLVDEPFAGLDPAVRHALAAHLRQLASEGVGVLLCDHDAQQSFLTCDRVYILTDGELLAEGPPAEVAADPRVRAAYLGERHPVAPGPRDD